MSGARHVHSINTNHNI